MLAPLPTSGPATDATTRRGIALVLAVALALASCSSDDATDPDPGTETTEASGETGDTNTAVDDDDASLSAPALLDVAALSTTTGTDGRTFLADGDGRALQLRGFNIKTEDPAADADERAFTDAVDRGFTLVRLSLYWHLLEPEQGVYDEDYLAEIEAAIDRAGDAGVNVVVSWHQDVFGPAFGFGGIPEWATRTNGLEYTQQDVWLANYLEPAVQAAWDHLYEDTDLREAQQMTWAMVAERFAGHPAVLGYDLLNEPFGRLSEDEDLEVAASRVQSDQLTPMFARLTDAIRAVDPDAWVFIKPPNVASIGLPVALGPIDDDRVVFFPHMYDAGIESATYSDGEIVFDAGFFETYEPLIVTYGAEHGVPTMIGEWGVANPDVGGMDRFVAESLALMDRVGSGWTMFTWCRGGGYCPIGEDGDDRPAIGQIVAPWARAIAGAPTSFNFDPETKVLRVVYADNDATGATELFVASATMYPDGFEVTTSADDAEWVHDAAADVVSVTIEATGGPHAICVHPADTPVTCDPS